MKTRLLLLLLVLLGPGAWAQQPAPAATPATSTSTNDAQQLEQEREKWNAVLTGKETRILFNARPNALLVEAIKGRPPGLALDVGMGQGRNTIYLAQQGWDAYGFDIADEAINLAQDNARKAGVKITTFTQSDEQFEFGTERWNLVAVLYAGGRELVPRIYRSLKPGGLVVIEAFHRDATRVRKISPSVVFDPDELRKLYEAAGFRILRYEEPEGIGDFGLQRMRLVKLVAQKP
ncbi:class I SAM-dependent methyltransferase [Hymenobacter weizhouensis]|uniref:class I SAM-dependent methyltransferase n=1 Tax=Hymenobacter sp. YIM 151500-1 TaxID=2987689 RepID=UPI002226A459|nr:class I SAM-dependent methyltransferase [Hymenobacter sp. YIM 151500-1]UYZ62972.1 class I SAM-dependent methyltransferase [Hymenobacter sp. YIM 151500-1]